MVAALALLAAFTAAALATSNLSLATRTHNAQCAQALAESAVQQAMAQLMGDPGFISEVSIDSRPGLPGGSFGYLTFDPANSRGLPYSTNNFEGGNSAGFERVVPRGSVHLVGTGYCAGVERHLEVVVHVPEFPVSIASDGPIEMRNTLIAAVEDATQISWGAGGLSYDASRLGPGDLVTNSQDPGRAVVLDPASRVAGDVQARGEVLVNGALVEGEVRSRWGEDLPMPEIVVDDYDPAGSRNTIYDPLAPGYLPNADLVGIVRVAGDLSVGGDVRLDNAFLFVDGDLTVDGALRGVGAVVVTGETRVQGGAGVRSNETIALLSKGDLTLEGRGNTQSLFQGLLYTQGSLRAVRVTVVGAFIAETGSSGTVGDVYVEDSRLLYLATSVAPAMRRDVYAVVPRFDLTQAGRPSTLDEDPDGFPFGGHQIPPGGGDWAGRYYDPRSALDPMDSSFTTSSWGTHGQGTIRVYWGNNQPHYYFSWWGPEDIVGPVDPSTITMGGSFHYNSREDFIRWFIGHTQLSRTGVPAESVVRANINATLDHLERTGERVDGANFVIDPNRFLEQGDRFRVQYRREF